MKRSFNTQRSNSRELSNPRLRAGYSWRAAWRVIAGGFAATCVAVCVLVSAAQPGTNAPVSSREDLSAFKLITDRNIFNTRRYATSVRSPDRYRDTGRSRSRGDSFALVGTMHYDKGPFAFFDGTRSDYRKVLKPDETIAGFKVTEILPSAVKLTSSTNQIELPIGMQLRREDENSDWVKSERPESAEPAGGVSSSSHLSFQSTTQPPVANGDFPNGVPDGAPPFPLDPNAAQAFFNGDQPPGQPGQPAFAATNAPPAGTEGITDPVILRMMQRRAQERGD